MKTVFWAVLLGIGASSVLVAGCNNGSCDYVSKCPNDPAVTPDEKTLCDNRKNDSQCGGEYNDYLACFQSNQTCAENGTTDFTITNGTCGDQYAKWVTCYYGVNGTAYDAGGQ